jgi:hypothetical protein
MIHLALEYPAQQLHSIDLPYRLSSPSMEDHKKFSLVGGSPGAVVWLGGDADAVLGGGYYLPA